MTEKELIILRNLSIKYLDKKTHYFQLKKQVVDKYFKLNGSVNCVLPRTILEIVKTKNVTDEEKVADIEILLQYLEFYGKNEALVEFIHSI